ncbi:AAA family ATPase [Glacieibacterium sp.]|uniref:AAA family ATPase n=1 Tax=Glacieibacterium sp. TaxID=2860237 RepID=UPI003AFF621F
MIWKRWSKGRSEDGATEARVEPFTAIDPRLRQRPAFLDALWRDEKPVSTGIELPRFAATASDDVESGEEPALARRRLALRDALGASQPVVARERFAGRHDALAQLIAAVEQQRVHVVIYGERGIGKTSLVHVFADTAREARYLVIYGSCGTEAKFDAMFRAFATKIPMLYHRNVLPTSNDSELSATFDSLLPEGAFGPREVSDLFADVVGTRIILILDEYDRVIDRAFRRDVAELIKNLSDRAARVQLVLTGVAQNLDELVGYAPSIRRNIVGLPMRPLSNAEVRSVLALGEQAAGLTYSDEAASMIATMAGGSPYLVRLLGHRAGMAALDQHRNTVDAGHGHAAVERVLTDWNASLPRRVQAILGRDSAQAQWPLLVAAARAGSSADGWFGIDDVNTELAGAIPVAAIERDLRGFAHSNDLLEVDDEAGEIRFRYRYPGVSSLLLMSAAMAKLAA